MYETHLWWVSSFLGNSPISVELKEVLCLG